MKLTKADIREEVIGLIGEAAWQYAYYNFNLDELIQNCNSVHEVAEIIQDLIANDLNNNTQKKS